MGNKQGKEQLVKSENRESKEKSTNILQEVSKYLDSGQKKIRESIGNTRSDWEKKLIEVQGLKEEEMYPKQRKILNLKEPNTQSLNIGDDYTYKKTTKSYLDITTGTPITEILIEKGGGEGITPTKTETKYHEEASAIAHLCSIKLDAIIQGYQNEGAQTKRKIEEKLKLNFKQEITSSKRGQEIRKAVIDEKKSKLTNECEQEIRQKIASEREQEIRQEVTSKHEQVIREDITRERGEIIKEKIRKERGEIIKENIANKYAQEIRQAITSKHEQIIRKNITDEYNKQNIRKKIKGDLGNIFTEEATNEIKQQIERDIILGKTRSNQEINVEARVKSRLEAKEIKKEIGEKVKEKIDEELKGRIEADVKNQIYKLKGDIEGEVEATIKETEVKEKIKGEAEKQIEGEAKKQIEGEVEATIKEIEVKEKIEEEVKEKIDKSKGELDEEVEATIKEIEVKEKTEGELEDFKKQIEGEVKEKSKGKIDEEAEDLIKKIGGEVKENIIEEVEAEKLIKNIKEEAENLKEKIDKENLKNKIEEELEVHKRLEKEVQKRIEVEVQKRIEVEADAEFIKLKQKVRQKSTDSKDSKVISEEKIKQEIEDSRKQKIRQEIVNSYKQQIRQDLIGDTTYQELEIEERLEINKKVNEAIKGEEVKTKIDKEVQERIDKEVQERIDKEVQKKLLEEVKSGNIGINKEVKAEIDKELEKIEKVDTGLKVFLEKYGSRPMNSQLLKELQWVEGMDAADRDRRDRIASAENKLKAVPKELAKITAEINDKIKEIQNIILPLTRQESDGLHQAPAADASTRQESDGLHQPAVADASTRQASDGLHQPAVADASTRQESDGLNQPAVADASTRQESDGLHQPAVADASTRQANEGTNQPTTVADASTRHESDGPNQAPAAEATKPLHDPLTLENVDQKIINYLKGPTSGLSDNIYKEIAVLSGSLENYKDKYPGLDEGKRLHLHSALLDIKLLLGKRQIKLNEQTEMLHKSQRYTESQYGKRLDGESQLLEHIKKVAKAVGEQAEATYDEKEWYDKANMYYKAALRSAKVLPVFTSDLFKEHQKLVAEFQRTADQLHSVTDPTPKPDLEEKFNKLILKVKEVLESNTLQVTSLETALENQNGAHYETLNKLQKYEEAKALKENLLKYIELAKGRDDANDALDLSNVNEIKEIDNAALEYLRTKELERMKHYNHREDEEHKRFNKKEEEIRQFLIQLDRIEISNLIQHERMIKMYWLAFFGSGDQAALFGLGRESTAEFSSFMALFR